MSARLPDVVTTVPDVSAVVGPDKLVPHLTSEELARHWGVHVRTVPRICVKIGLRPLVLGAKTVLYRQASILKAEEDWEKSGRKNPKKRKETAA